MNCYTKKQKIESKFNLNLKKYFISVLEVVATATFSPIFLYCQNADEASFREIMPAIILIIGISIIMFVLFQLLTRTSWKAALITAFCMLSFLHFSFFEQGIKTVLTEVKYWHTAPAFVLLCLHVAYGIHHFVKEEWAADIVKVVCLVFGGLIIFNFVTSLPQIISFNQAQAELREARTQRGELSGDVTLDMPNVYLFMFDEYASFTQMDEYYNYDNADLKDFLVKNNFGISYSSHNESDQSATIQTNLVNLDYVVKDNTSSSDKTVLRENGLIFELFREKGYQVQILESSGFYGGALPESNKPGRTGAVTIGGESLSDILMKRSIVYPLWRYFVDTDRLIDEKITILADYLSDGSNLPQGGTFTLAYFNCPHQPFITDEYGNMTPASQWQNWEEPRYYLGQYKYTTKQMLRMLENLMTNDTDAIIILQSDHGARHGAADNMPTRDIRTNIFNAVYYQGDNIEIEGLTGINTLRTVLNKLFDMDYEMLPLPEWRFK